MRGLRRLILLFFVVIIGLPLVIGGAALIKDESPPDYLVNYDNSFNTEEVIMQKLNTMALSNVLGVSNIYIDEVTVNKIIYKNANGFTDSKVEISNGEFIELEYVWTHFANNELSIYALIKYQSVSTTITLKLGFSEATDGLKISFNQFKVGQLPFPKALFSYAMSSLVKYAGLNLEDEYTYGDISYDDLFITIDQEHIQNLINENLDNNLILFDSINLKNGKFIINYNFNTEGSPEAAAVQATIDELNTILSSEQRAGELTGDVATALDLTDKNEQQFNEDFNDVIDLLQNQVNNPENMTDLTDKNLATFASMGTSYSNMDPETQQEVAKAIEGNINPDVITQVNEALQALEIEGYNSITDLLVGSGQ